MGALIETETTAANLQTRLTVKDGAALFNVSERLIYMARELMAANRPDLVAAVEAGRILRRSPRGREARRASLGKSTHRCFRKGLIR